MEDHSPWGPIQSSTSYGDGVRMVETAGHGGFLVDRAVNAGIPAHLRIASGAYEEDCDWALVVLALPERFPDDLTKIAIETVRNWRPHAYEKHFGVELQPGESLMRDRKLFKEAHAEDWVAIAAIGLDTRHEDGSNNVEVTAAIGGDRSRSDHATFIVPNSEYRTRGRHGFVIDPERHPRIDTVEPEAMAPAGP